MSFAVSADAYDGYMGRYSRRLAPQLADFAGIEPGQRVLDVGCGPGALTSELAVRVGANRVAAADPAQRFAQACAARVRGADVRTASAEALPWPAGSFDAVLSQLVVSFIADADAGIGEMRRVAHRGGTITACSWDYADQMQMLRIFWDAALALDPGAPDEARVMGYSDPDSLRELWLRAGLRDVETGPLVVHAEYADFAEYWEPFLSGTGPAGAYCASLDAGRRAALRDECCRRLGAPQRPFALAARAWAVRGIA
ncbi:MAG: class I SAM-dependent methyltransferase [Solirubrobacteraceae bacterium]